MAVMGVSLSDFSVPVCNSFQAKILNNQLCYEADINRLKGKGTDNIKTALKLGLGVVLDYNEDRQVILSENDRENNGKVNLIRTFENYEDSNDEAVSIFIETTGKPIPFPWALQYIHLFLQYLDTVNLEGEGIYILNAVKYLNVTESFLGLDQDVRECQNLSNSKCRFLFLKRYSDNQI